MLTDLLASYQFVPGTVIHAGFGSLYEKDFAGMERMSQHRSIRGTSYLMINRGLFLKASYLRWF